ncbi:hypothetical protein NUKP49_50460 [Klebsiella variicola]|nr:hypothetical protein NUKP49_50460 [Klebsiella variicola]
MNQNFTCPHTNKPNPFNDFNPTVNFNPRLLLKNFVNIANERQPGRVNTVKTKIKKEAVFAK